MLDQISTADHSVYTHSMHSSLSTLNLVANDQGVHTQQHVSTEKRFQCVTLYASAVYAMQSCLSVRQIVSFIETANT